MQDVSQQEVHDPAECPALHRPHLLDQAGWGPVRTQSARHSRWEGLFVKPAKQGASLAQRLQPRSAPSDSTHPLP
eukprot:5720406-Pyramimonas_sp.AAC.1